MIKRILLSALVLSQSVAFAQIPAGYYNTAAGLNGQPLRVALRNIIRPHTMLTYTPGLWNAYHTTDVKPSGKVWDMYSDIPGGTPAYEYTMTADQCGSVSPSAEGSCYNREHSWPQSKFNSDTPMVNDLVLVIPTDYYVNGQRGNLPYGIVGGTPAHIFTNGSKLGSNTYAGSPSGSCYEPLDSFKGDLARTYFYIATCYWGADSASFLSWEMANGLTFKPWAIQMLLEWHHNDPVSQKEINRNNAAYPLQNNRNPFIDHPEYADCIWGTVCATGIENTTTGTATVNVSTDPANNLLNINWNEEKDKVASMNITNMNGQVIYTISPLNTSSATINTSSWARGIYVLRVQSLHNMITKKIIVQ